MAGNKTLGDYGNGKKGQNVFALAFDEDLSAVCEHRMYDGATFPATGSAVTVANTVFAGTTKNGNKPMISLFDGSNAAPTTFDWKPWAATGGQANPNRMKGTVNYVFQSGAALAGGVAGTYDSPKRLRFTFVVEVANDTTTSSTMNVDHEITYSFTGTAPTPKFQYNSGSEGTPTWTDMVAGTDGIKHTRSGATSTTLFANIPALSYVSPVIFDGAGVDDGVSGGVSTSVNIGKFEVEVDGTAATNTFKWRKNEGAYTTGVAMTGAAQTLSDGVTITFGATGGHTLADVWTFYVGAEDTIEGWQSTV